MIDKQYLSHQVTKILGFIKDIFVSLCLCVRIKITSVPLWLILLFFSSSSAWAESRFPKPEFETGYEYPHEIHQMPRVNFLEYFDVLMLVLALAVTSYLVHKRRSRKLVLLTAGVSLAYFGFYREGCVCSVGSLQNVTLALADSGYAIPLTALLFFVIPLGFALYYGRTFCASVCPLGCAQELVAFKPIRIPSWVSQMLGLIPYAYLGLAVLYTAAGGMFIVCQLDPFVGFFRFNASSSMFAFGAMFLVTGIFIARPYCRFLCPYGVLLGWFSFFSKHQAQVSPGKCVSCRLCEVSCPFDAIHPANSEARSEGAEGRIRRFILTVIGAPLLIGALTWLGGNLDGIFAQVHPTVELAKQIRAEEAGVTKETTLISREFRRTGTTLEQLYAEELQIRERFRIGSYLLGFFLGLVFSVKLLMKCVRRYHDDYRIDSVHCYDCARCFTHCPQDEQNHELITAMQSETSKDMS